MRLPVVLSILTVVSIAQVASACEFCRAAGSSLHELSMPGTVAGTGLAPALGGGALAVPAFSSRPSAPAKLYLDFDGDYTALWGSFSPGNTPAYTLDTDPTTFSPAELLNIDRIWQGVAEKFSPFDVDVTTVDPGPLTEFGAYRIVIGGTGSWYALAGGVAYVGGFTSTAAPNTAFVFSENLLPADPLHAGFVTAASAHEAGHGFGLIHQSAWDGTTFVGEYNRGDAVKAPIMGSSYRKRGIWWRGPTITSTTIQNDLSILGDPEFNGFGYRSDDHGNTRDSATPLDLNSGIWTGGGVIERTNDIDYFSFDFAGGVVDFVLNVAPYEAMLDAAVSLYNLGGELLLTRDTETLGESFTINLAAGSYYIAVRSHGAFGDIGQFSLSGSVAIPEPSFTLGLIGLIIGVSGRRNRSKTRPIL